MTPLSPTVVELDGPFEHEFLHTRGIRLHAATAGNPDNPLVVLLHGSFGGWFDFRDVIAVLADAGFHVAALDMRGFGMSDKPPLEPGQDIRVAVGDVSGAIRALGHDDAFLVGADTGGAVAWALATERPERVRGLVSVSAAHPADLRRAIAARPWDFGWVLLRATLCRMSWLRTPRLLMRESAYRREMDLDALGSFSEDAREESLRLRIAASRIGNVRRGILWNHRLRTAVVPLSWLDLTVAAPVLFIHADQLLWRPVARRAARRCRGSFTATTIPGTKNLPFLENPRGFAQTLIQWMRST
ncbi:alpha/beta fold hydrolase [Corynebacterium minutissimum]|uniref:Hydrolase n=1 Tax=Corynebacterium minutissimum TaxID=38301 RepID=A0A2X4RFJ2_9CORY|nr:alpha/beta hydrolase [Corynebacterium minutissimum]KHO30199.1 hydrolase [Corynebacterium minutissimum]QPS60167.1 alpha/beta hydrolase [Corynebacterium minutissimum]QQA79043.1 alpha/beta hydrolase [Corynebacterium minutissimum]SQI01006.1 hydrolase [Corynebacterium minutissimum]VEG04926.1 hydrolase [Corynebacterium minutissimum]